MVDLDENKEDKKVIGTCQEGFVNLNVALGNS